VPSSIIEALSKRAAASDPSANNPIKLDSAMPPKILSQPSRGENQRVVGQEQGMRRAAVGLRVRLASGVRGNGVSGEKGEGSIQWVSKAGDVCHVRWDEASRFDYSYCCGHNGFFDLEIVPDVDREAFESVQAQAAPCKAESWSVADVQEFVESLRTTFGAKCNSYKLAFQREDIDGRAMLALQDEDLKELGLSLGHRKVFGTELAKLASDAARVHSQSIGEERGGTGSKEEAFTGVITERKDPDTATMEPPQRHQAAPVTEDNDGESRSLRAAMRSAPSLSSPFGVVGGAGNVSPTAETALDPREDLREGDHEDPGSGAAHVSLFKKKMESLKLRREAGQE